MGATMSDAKHSASKKISKIGIPEGLVNRIENHVVPIIKEKGIEPAIDAIEKSFPMAKAHARSIVNSIMESNSNLDENKKNTVTETNDTIGGVQIIRGGDSEFDGVDDSAYLAAAERHTTVGGFSGGYDCAFSEGGCGCTGGFIPADEMDTTTIKDYANSANSKTKDAIIDELIAVGKKLGMDIKGSTKEEQIKSILTNFPANKQFSANNEDQIKICKSIAAALNRAHGTKVVNMDLSPEIICQQVAELISSLDKGMHTEFLAVYNDVRKIIKNLNVLRDSLSETFDQVSEKISSSDDSSLSRKTSTLKDLHKMLTTEIDRQIKLLTNLLNVTMFPTDKTLASLIKDKKNIHGYIEKIDTKTGSKKFGKVISDILKGLGLTASFALIVEKSLKTVGITLDEYEKEGSVTVLRNKISQNLLDKTLSEEELHEYLKAAELLYKNFYRNVDIVKTIREKKGSHDMNIDQDDYTPESNPTHGGSEYPKTHLDKRIKDRKQLRNLIFNAFYKQLNSYFDAFINSLDVLTMKIGVEIPMSDQLDGFRHIMQRIDQSLVRNKNIYYALIGYYNDALSKSKKDTLVGDLKMVNSYIETILEMPLYKPHAKYFSDAYNQIKAMLDLIDKFSDEIAAKFGRGEEEDTTCKYIEDGEVSGGYSGGACSPTTDLDFVEGGYLNDSLIKEPEIKYKPTKSISDAIRQFDYKYRVSQIKSNMLSSGKELSHYSEKYEKIVANSVANLLEGDKKKYETLRKELESKFNDVTKFNDANINGFTSADDYKKQLESAKRMLDYQWDTKKKFWATVEAVDAYMRVFTDGLVNNPNDIKEIKSMLEEIEVIDDWYNDSTGSILTSVFDHFPSSFEQNVNGNINTSIPEYPDKNEYITKATNSHYYEIVKIQLETNNNPPGNPSLVTSPVRGEDAKNQTKKALSGLSVLKNLISVFSHIGSKFGGEELKKKVFMTPTQMYNNIVEYLQASAFTQGYGITDFGESIGNGHYTLLTEFGTHATPSDLYSTLEYEGMYHPVLDEAEVGDLFSTVAGPANAARINVFNRNWGVWMRGITNHRKLKESFMFKSEDEYFVLIMKSIAGKIFTVTGMYDVFDRPYEFNGINPIRMIIGGNEELPKIISEAMPLYLRLPLLAQFYRNIFNYESDEEFKTYDQLAREDTNVKISMIPDIEGVFAGLIRIIFRKTTHVDSNAYSDDDVSSLIREINSIYQKMSAKYPNNAVTETIHEFVAEINRRYGIVSDRERNDYEKEFGNRYDYSNFDNNRTNEPYDRYSEAPETNYAILPGEEEEEVVRPSPAQRLLGETFESKEKKSMYKVTTQHKELVYKFRCQIDKFFENPEEEYTFTHAIKSAQIKIKNASPENQFKIVASLIRGVDIHSKVDGMKYIVFHETVVAGLNTLSAIHTNLARFKIRAQLLNIRAIEEQIWTYLETYDNTNPNVNQTEEDVFMGLQDNIAQFIADRAGVELTVKIRELVNISFGCDEANIRNGGHLLPSNQENNSRKYALKGVNGIPIVIGNNHKLVIPRFTGANLYRHISDGSHNTFKKEENDQVFSNDIRAVNAPTRHADIRPPVRGNPIDPNVSNNSLMSILIKYGVKYLKKAYYSNKRSEGKNVAETFMRFIFNREYLMKNLVETLFGIGNDFQNLVDVKISDEKIYLNYGNLKKHIEDMFQHVNYFLDVIRPHVKTELITQYTDKFTPGSYYWLQEQLMEKIIYGRKPQLTDSRREGSPRAGYISLDESMQGLIHTYKSLTKEWKISGGQIHLQNEPVEQVNQNTCSRTSYDKVFAEMIYYDASKPESGLFRSNEASDVSRTIGMPVNGLKVIDFLHDPYEALNFNGPPGAKILDTRFAARFYQLYSWKSDFTLNRSLLYTFNQLVAKYIQSFYDPSAGKIYAGCINQIANSAFSRAVQDLSFTYPDTAPLFHVGQSVQTKMNIPTNTTLASTLSMAILNNIPTYSEVVYHYLIYGTQRGDINKPDKRASLLSAIFAGNGARGYFKTAVNDGNDDIALGVNQMADNIPKISLYLTVYIMALIIKKIFDANPQNIPREALNFIGHIVDPDAANGGQRADIASMNAARNLYGVENDVTPSFEQIIYKITDGGARRTAARLARVFYCITQVDTSASVNCLFSQISTMRGVNDEWRIYAGKLYTYYNNNIKFNNDAGAYTNAGLPAMAAQYFPHDTNSIGRNDAEIKYWAELYTTILLSLKETNNDAEREEIKRKIYTTPNTYTPPQTNAPQTSIKYETALTVNTQYFKSKQVGTPASDVSYLVLARKENINNALPQDNMKNLGGKYAQNDDSNLLKNILHYGKRMDPDGDHILFTSIASILRNLITSRSTSTQSLVYLTESVGEITLYMKEQMRANLPGFKNLFKELVSRCDFIKKFMGQKSLDVTREWTMTAETLRNNYNTGIVPQHNPWPYVLKNVTHSSNDTKNRFSEIIDSIVRGSSTFISICDQVLREIGDDPKYFEIYQNSIKDYKAQYNVDPLMPISTTLLTFKNSDKESYKDFLPIYTLNEEKFKFAYGTRSLIGQPTSQTLADNVPGFNNIIDQFNLISDGKMQLDKKRTDAYLKTFVGLLRYTFELKHIKGLITSYVIDNSFNNNVHNPIDDIYKSYHVGGLFTRDDLVLTANQYLNPTVERQALVAPPAVRDFTFDYYTINRPVILTNKSDISMTTAPNVEHGSIRKPYLKTVYAITKPFGNSIKLTESSFKDEKIKELVEYIVGTKKKRNSLEIQNIIDLNIVPINVHALQRSLPLANLYNYGYTFDRLIIELYYGLTNQHARELISKLCSTDSYGKLSRINNAADMLVALLLDPYLDVHAKSDEDKLPDVNHYEKYVKPMLKGTARNGDLGRPKFLSDQIFNKAIFGEVYNGEDEMNEVGPPAGHVYRVKNDINTIKETVIQIVLQSTSAPPRGIANTSKILDAIIIHVMDNKNISLTDLYNLIMERIYNNQATRQQTELSEKYVGIIKAACLTIFYLTSYTKQNAFYSPRDADNFIACIYRWITVLISYDDHFNHTSADRNTLIGRLNDNNIGDLYGAATLTSIKEKIVDDMKYTGYNNGGVSVNIVNPNGGPNRTIRISNMYTSLITKGNLKNTHENHRTHMNKHISLHYLTGPTQSTQEPVDCDEEPDNSFNPRGVNKIVELPINHELAHVLQYIGKERFNTRLIRNLIFIINLYRSVLLKLRKDLTYNKDIITRSTALARPQITEFFGNNIDANRDRSGHPLEARYKY